MGETFARYARIQADRGRRAGRLTVEQARAEVEPLTRNCVNCGQPWRDHTVDGEPRNCPGWAVTGGTE